MNVKDFYLKPAFAIKPMRAFVFFYQGGVVMGIAKQMEIPIRRGGDWNQNKQVPDPTFFDLPHFELN